jgi:NAD(P)-dependent dehydrogenase (short-subunit alcohol dehydrogenase family)
MLPLLENKIVFISGGSQGLGASIARAAVREGTQAAPSSHHPEAAMSYSATGLSWVQNSYTLVFGRLLPPGGRLRRALLAVLEVMLSPVLCTPGRQAA